MYIKVNTPAVMCPDGHLMLRRDSHESRDRR